jgi:hypothetical protein
MARINVYLPDDLAEGARALGLNVSKLTQEALKSAIDSDKLTRWLDKVDSNEPLDIDPEAVKAALSGAKDELEGLDRTSGP